ncbi:MAG: HAD family hydrolase, partial [Eubacteriales bacterium]
LTNFALASFGYPERTLDEVRSFVGNGIAMLIEKAIPGGRENPLFSEVLACFKEHYGKNCNNKTRPYDGIIELLEKLKKAYFKIAVVSNKVDSAVKELCGIYFPGMIDAAIGETDKIKRKPAPDEVLFALRLLGSEKEDSVYIGDSEVDIATGINSGIDVISVSWGFRAEDTLLSAGAKIIARSPDEVFEIISKK